MNKFKTGDLICSASYKKYRSDRQILGIVLGVEKYYPNYLEIKWLIVYNDDEFRDIFSSIKYYQDIMLAKSNKNV